MNDIDWDKIMIAEFRSLVYLSEDEEIVLMDWAGKKNIGNTEALKNMSARKINRIRKRIRDKYDAVQIYTPLLPPREPK